MYHSIDEAGTGSEVAKKVNRKRVKSVYRDALYRPLFQAVAAIEEARANGETSVTLHTPSHPHPLYRTLHLSPLTSPTTSTISLPEPLTDEEEIRAARHWRTFYAETPRKHRVPAHWRDLSDEAALEWFHHALRASGPVSAFSLDMDAETESLVRQASSSAGWLSKRIARRLKAALGRSVDFWFAFETTPDHRLHLHGELGVSSNELPAARKALRLAGGEWKAIRQHQAHTRQDPTAIWSNYAAKNAIFIRPLKGGRFANLPRDINGDWLFATNKVRAGAQKIYTARRKEVLQLMESLSL